jgi:hypothetical protein
MSMSATWPPEGRLGSCLTNTQPVSGSQASDQRSPLALRQIDLVRTVTGRHLAKLLARDRGIGVIVNRPFREGELLRKIKRHPLPGWAAEIGCFHANFRTRRLNHTGEMPDTAPFRAEVSFCTMETGLAGWACRWGIGAG